MRVAWVHPSWRDLVIAELSEDAAERRRFLAACGLDGVLLAVSVGGARGECELPLLVDDADWDAVGDALHRLVGELAEDELTGLLRALLSAHATSTDRHAVTELAALARQALGRCAGRRLGVDALEAWFELADAVGGVEAVPELDPALLELDIEAVDVRRPEGRERLSDWLRLLAIAPSAGVDLRARGIAAASVRRARVRLGAVRVIDDWQSRSPSFDTPPRPVEPVALVDRILRDL